MGIFLTWALAGVNVCAKRSARMRTVRIGVMLFRSLPALLSVTGLGSGHGIGGPGINGWSLGGG